MKGGEEAVEAGGGRVGGGVGVEEPLDDGDAVARKRPVISQHDFGLDLLAIQ